uniref:Uncharacterized protein n=1 Tax=Anopheles christyi TaxID=43041 RepID=A0A182KHN2_9DIPT
MYAIACTVPRNPYTTINDLGVAKRCSQAGCQQDIPQSMFDFIVAVNGLYTHTHE